MPRVLPHFKVHVSVQSHRKMVGCYGENDLLATWVRIGVRFVDRFGDRTRDRVLVTEADLLALTGASSLENALKTIRLLAKTCPIRVRKKARTYEIHFPNFAKKQGFGDREWIKKGKESGPSASASASASATKKEESKRARSRPRKQEVPYPVDGLSGSDRARLDAWAEKHGYPPLLVSAKIEAIRLWAEAGDERKAGWVATIMGAIRRDAEESTDAANRSGTSRGGGRSPTPLQDAAAAVSARRRC